MRCFSLGFSLLLLFCAVAGAQPTPPRSVPPEILNRYQQLYASLQPSARGWVNAQARDAVARHSLDLAQLRTNVSQRFPSLRSEQNGKVMAMVLMVLTAAIQQTNDDKNNYLQKLAEINTISQQLNNQIAQLAQNGAAAGPHPKSDTDTCTTPFCRSLSARITSLNGASARLPHPLHLQVPANPTYGDLQRLMSNMKTQLNSLADDTQMDEINLQNAMQSYNQAVSLISDTSKEMNDTAMSIISNLK